MKPLTKEERAKLRASAQEAGWIPPSGRNAVRGMADDVLRLLDTIDDLRAQSSPMLSEVIRQRDEARELLRMERSENSTANQVADVETQRREKMERERDEARAAAAGLADMIAMENGGWRPVLPWEAGDD